MILAGLRFDRTQSLYYNETAKEICCGPSAINFINCRKENTMNFTETIQAPAADATVDSSYLDIVNEFDLLYKVTPSIEQPESLIHYHDCYELIFYVSAKIEVYLDDVHYSINSHDLLIIPPRKIHKIIYAERCNYIRYVFYFTQEQIQNAFLPSMIQKALFLFRDRGQHKLSLSAHNYIKINNVFQNMYEHIKEMSAANYYLITNYASILLQELYLLYGDIPDSSKERILTPVEQILNYINENYSQQITLDNLAEKYFLNKSYICRIFRKTMGISLVTYLQYKRILEAQNMLLNSDKSIIDIAMDCGFSNVQHFYRVFKKITNLTPSEYKKHQPEKTLGLEFSLDQPSRRGTSVTHTKGGLPY